MSEVFVGIFLKEDPEVVEKYITAHPLKNDVSASSFLPGLTAVSIQLPRRAWELGTKIDELAAFLSTEFSTALLVGYDTRCSHRESTIYREGFQKETFGENDELFVLLDPKGKPILDAPRIKFADFEPGKEYETILNAIQLGFTSFGSGTWAEFKTFISQRLR